mmetsp:Transcript_6744/g.19056  ORF Transcript_6744/g.19056 Transcript_6744/m.19056 type:complete len:508 (+) Transcript_6744:72-1595(+)
MVVEEEPAPQEPALLSHLQPATASPFTVGWHQEPQHTALSAAIQAALQRSREEMQLQADMLAAARAESGEEAEEEEGEEEAGDHDATGNSGARVLLPSADGSSDARTVEEAVRILLAREPRCIPSKAPLVLLEHRSPEQPVLFGRWFGKERAPVVLLQSYSEALAEYLRDDPEGPFARLRKEPPVFPIPKDSVWSRWAFEEDAKEQLLKADWHSVPHLSQKSGLFVPRLAKWGSVLRGPPRIVAFMMAFRAVNRPVWLAITEALTGLRHAREEESKEYRDEGRGKLLGTFIECFQNSRHFGVVEAQVGFVNKPWRQPSHKDGATSLLHLGVTLGGERTLRAGLFPGCASQGNLARVAAADDGQDPDPNAGERNVWDEDLWSKQYLKEEDMRLGSVYLSSPFCFEHAVQYSGCARRDEPVIALMCRWGLPEDLGRHINEMRSEDMLDVTTVIANCLRIAGEEGQLRMPSLDEIKQGEARLARLDREEAERTRKVREKREQRLHKLYSG